MKTKILLMLCLFIFFVGCKKSEDPDPRDNYVGSWSLSKLNNKASTNATIITVKKETAITAMSMNWFDSSSTDYVTLNSSNFTFDKVSILYLSDFVSSGIRYRVEFENGTGKINGTILIISFDIKFTNLSNNQVSRLTGSDGWIEEYTKK
jgi:hypothetical protein